MLSQFNKLTDYLYEIPKRYRSDMRVPARIYTSKKLLAHILTDHTIDQLLNVATLPGIKNYALAMPDAHEGYGFPVGGVAAFDVDTGIISPGGIGYDINCGVRLLRTDRLFDEVKPYLEEFSHALFREIPTGAGRSGFLKLKSADLDKVLNQGSKRIVEMGYGQTDDLNGTESEGNLKTADASLVSEMAKKRGRDQLGTMGGGNHFVEVDRVEKIFDSKTAETLGLAKNQVVFLIHTGSRGLGHQIATDYIRLMMQVMPKYHITIPDRELACAPYNSPEGQDYFSAMCAGANFAWANRQLITWEIRRAWEQIFGRSGGDIELVYDVAHNIAKIEKYHFGNVEKEVVVHRKGATRSFPNQPVLIPGSMGTASYVLLGQKKSLNESFGSSCHGAGRRMSRSKAIKQVEVSKLKQELAQQGILISAGSMRGLAEEAPIAYKDVDEVVEIVDQAGIAKKVARLRPIAVVKG